jgi:biotin carboxylase
MKTLFDENGIPCARHELVNTYETALDFIKRCPYPVVVKPVAGAGSQTTFKVTSDAEMLAAFTTMGHISADGVIIEEFIQGDEYSARYLFIEWKSIGPIHQSISTHTPRSDVHSLDPMACSAAEGQS